MRRQRILAVLGICLVALATGAIGSVSGSTSITGVIAIGAGSTHTCAVTAGGGLQCWGDDSSGQLGDGFSGDDDNSTVPVEVVGLESSVVAVDGGETHTCALTTVGGVKCWGGSYLGDGSGGNSWVPVGVLGLETGVSSISVMFWHACAVTMAGGVKCWGDNQAGQLGGDCGLSVCDSPVDVAGLESGVAAVAAGRIHTCALTTAGGVKCWGWNSFGMLGDGTATDSPTPVDVIDENGDPLTGVAAIAAGFWHTCALSTTGSLKCWGMNISGQLGDGTSGTGNFSSVAVDVQGLGSGVSAIAEGGFSSCALMAGGGIKCWGDNSEGQLGAATTEMCPQVTSGSGPDVSCSSTPLDVQGLAGGSEAISAGDVHTCAILPGTRVMCWGDNSVGQLGDGTLTSNPVPVEVRFDADEDGCTDGQELAAAPALGGLRDPESFWDFYDTPDSVNVRDRIVSVADIGRVAARFGTSGDPAIDPLSAPPASGYHTAFDRSPPAQGAELWQPGPPDGSISIGDIGSVVAQFGHSCM